MFYGLVSTLIFINFMVFMSLYFLPDFLHTKSCCRFSLLSRDISSSLNAFARIAPIQYSCIKKKLNILREDDDSKFKWMKDVIDI